MENILFDAKLSHLAETLSHAVPDQLISTLRNGGRPALLEELKTLGVAKLPERQKLASALAKRERAATLPARAPCVPRACHTPSAADIWTHVEWSDGGWRFPDDAAASCDSSGLANILVVEDVLTRTECLNLVRKAENIGFVASTHQGKRDEGFRRGGRALITDGGLAAEMFARIARHLPRTPHAASSAEAAQWAMPAGLWESLRVLSYDANDYFLAHRDNACAVGHSSLLPACRSFYSIVLYLEDSADGSGATRFYCEEPEVPEEPEATPLPSAQQLSGASAANEGGTAADRTESRSSAADDQPNVEANTGSSVPPQQARAHRPTRGLVADVVPWAGRAVVFPHRMLHESMPVVTGRKLVVRGDVLYAQTQQPTSASSLAHAPAPEPEVALT